MKYDQEHLILALDSQIPDWARRYANEQELRDFAFDIHMVVAWNSKPEKAWRRLKQSVSSRLFEVLRAAVQYRLVSADK